MSQERKVYKPPMEKRLNSQLELVRLQGAIVREHLDFRLSSEVLVTDAQDLRRLLRGVENFRESLIEYQDLIQEAQE